MGVVFSAIVLIATILALADIITRDSSLVKHLPKVVWVLLVIFVPLIGTVLWFAIGREYSSGDVIRMPAPRRTEHSAPPAPTTHRTTEEQLADIDREIEYYRRRAELERLKHEAEPDATA